jgi:hypothetical protein
MGEGADDGGGEGFDADGTEVRGGKLEAVKEGDTAFSVDAVMLWGGQGELKGAHKALVIFPFGAALGFDGVLNFGAFGVGRRD